jgi:hypothetical protein
MEVWVRGRDIFLLTMETWVVEMRMVVMLVDF